MGVCPENCKAGSRTHHDWRPSGSISLVAAPKAPSIAVGSSFPWACPDVNYFLLGSRHPVLIEEWKQQDVTLSGNIFAILDFGDGGYSGSCGQLFRLSEVAGPTRHDEFVWGRFTACCTSRWPNGSSQASVGRTRSRRAVSLPPDHSRPRPAGEFHRGNSGSSKAHRAIWRDNADSNWPGHSPLRGVHPEPFDCAQGRLDQGASGRHAKVETVIRPLEHPEPLDRWRGGLLSPLGLFDSSFFRRVICGLASREKVREDDMASKADSLSRVRANVLILAYVAFVALGLPASLMGVAWPTLRAELSLPLDALGVLLTSSTIGYLISSAIIARLISRFGIGSLLMFSSLVSAAAFFGYTIAPSWAVIIAMGAVSGFGAGVIDAGLNTYLASEYNEGQMQWLHASFGFGATLSPLIMTASLALFGSWRPAYVFVAALTGIMAICFLLTLPAWKRPKHLPTQSGRNEDSERGLMDYNTSLRDTLLRVATWISILIFLLYTGAELTLGNWIYTLFTEGRGVSPQLAGLWTGGFWATFTIGRVVAGLYARRIPLNTTIYGALILSMVGVILLWWNPIVLVGAGGVLILGFAMAPIFPGLVSSTSRRVGQRHAANTIGIQMSAAGLGGALLPFLAGILAERTSLEIIPAMLSVSLLGLLILCLPSSRARTADEAVPQRR
jgi:fucose permease